MSKNLDDKVLERINLKKTVTIEMICSEFAISESTCRRVFKRLDEKGLILRFHGGANSLDMKQDNIGVYDRYYTKADLKEMIAKKAAKMVKPFETIFLMGGTTVFRMCKFIKDLPLKVITNSLLVFSELSMLKKEENKEDKNLIKSLKAGLFGPLAGLGDAIFWFTVLPIVAGISASFAKSGNILGPIFFFLCYCLVFASRFLWTNMGYKLGTTAIDTIQKSSQLISRSASILGITVLGGLIPSYVNLHIATTFNISAGHKFSIQKDFLDHIFPNILPLAYTLFIFYLLKKKKMNPVLLICLTIVFAIVGSYFGILG